MSTRLSATHIAPTRRHLLGSGAALAVGGALAVCAQGAAETRAQGARPVTLQWRTD